MSADREQERKKHMKEKLAMKPPPQKHNNDTSNTRGKEKGGVTNGTDVMDAAEKERRQKFKSLFAQLHAMLPHVPGQADKVTVVDETMNSIRILEQTLKDLEKKKLERLHSSIAGSPTATSKEAFISEHGASSSSILNSHNDQNPEVKFQTWTSPNVAVNVSGQQAQFNVCSDKNNRCLFTKICSVLDKYKIDVLSAHISCDNNNRRFYMFQAQMSKDLNQPPTSLSAEETFKQAAAEIIQRLS
ncbi:hypothetical protein QN277_001393 [Acacia crassicarpa]|uniref:BHLH domain-containing protein n=1 Tax=Acacia crassicarpa TaxID=499986 RepID=A0AAE1N9L8_9FABA|nr:hypothetical protein QN277_001393 [Acacia crassicarpa]